jgi:transposase
MESEKEKGQQAKQVNQPKKKEMNNVNFDKISKKRDIDRTEQVLFRASKTDKKQLKELAEKFETTMSHVLRVAIGAMHRQMIQEQPKKSNK